MNGLSTLFFITVVVMYQEARMASINRSILQMRCLAFFSANRSRFFIIRHIHNHTSIISSEMQVELKKNTAFT